MKDYLIIFGAAVRPNGRPSAALRRRVDPAIRLARSDPNAMLLPTGGRGANGLSEAEMMRDLFLDAGIDAGRIVVETQGRDTLESVRKCHDILTKRGDCSRIICCTSSYHQPRCSLLLRLLRYKVVVPPVSGTLGRLSRATYVRMVLKEMFALPYDAAILLARRRGGRAK